jgi:hypothetical protein
MRGNKGEWSEVYTFLKLLGDGVIYGGDDNLERINSIFYPLVSVIREESDGKYIYSREVNINVIDSEGRKLLEIDNDRFIKKAEDLLCLIKASSGSSFEFPEIERFLKHLHVEKLKSSSGNKRDITIVVHDLNTNTTPTLGFSIKSRLGGNSTLLNPGESTNFIFQVENIDEHKYTPEKILNSVNDINTRSKIKDRTKFLISDKNALKFCRIQSGNLHLNLQMIDSLLPEILSEVILYYYSGRASSIKDLVGILERENPLKFDQSNDHKFYEYKIKNFLTDVALGMTPERSWTGHYDATGGYIIVKEDGDIVCYHIYNRNEFQNYLLNHTLLDTPSSSRYHFGKVYKENNKYYFKLNLQIRFK